MKLVGGLASNSSSLRLEIDLPKSDSHIDSIMLQPNVLLPVKLNYRKETMRMQKTCS